MHESRLKMKDDYEFECYFDEMDHLSNIQGLLVIVLEKMLASAGLYQTV